MGGKIYRIPDRSEVGMLKYFITLLRILSKINPDVIHSHAMFNSGAIMFASFLVGIKKRISHSHNTADQSEENVQRKIFRLVMRFFIIKLSNGLLACSQDAARYLFGNKIVNMGKSHVVNNAIDVKKFKFNKSIRNRVRTELSASGKLVIGHVGRFNKQKNHEFLIDIFKAINDKNPKSILVMVGNGELKAIIEKKTRNLGITSAVRFLGVRDDISNLMQGMDVFLLPS
ncbi:glycosyltransferase [Bacillus sp. OK048]|uniref:glycosyltransferase n=1 Tax=Bacillus sp. OK048 TaxID=1882761 RepID=UPI000888BD34|nr:glycosyltransferase [Bacillus sp. OK048]SDM77855.1 Glycosyltransferase Family 4 [Bacillus sp. OK048]